VDAGGLKEPGELYVVVHGEEGVPVGADLLELFG
jgi:hypothetical protein